VRYILGHPRRGVIYGTKCYNGTDSCENTADGTAINATTQSNVIVMNNIFQGFATPLVWTTNEPTNIFNYNAYFNKTSSYNTDVTEGTNSINLNATVFTAGTPYADSDHRVATNVKAFGFPAWGANLGINASWIGYIDVGAVQKIESTCSSSGGGGWAF